MTERRWDKPGLPHTGWYCVDMKDFWATRSGVCEMCGKTRIRYLHIMAHDQHPDYIGVGRVCAGHLESNQPAAKLRESRLKSWARRRANWLSRKWKRSAAGNDYLNIEGLNIVVYYSQTYSNWSSRIVDKASNEKIWYAYGFPSQNAAKMAAFDAFRARSQNEEEEG